MGFGNYSAVFLCDVTIHHVSFLVLSAEIAAKKVTQSAVCTLRLNEYTFMPLVANAVKERSSPLRYHFVVSYVEI